MEKKFHLVNWLIISKEKTREGLNIKCLSTLSKTLLDQWSKRYVLEREAFWKQVIKEKFGEEEGGWGYYIRRDGYKVKSLEDY